MANRESQGLQIALILFVMITVVLAVTTFVFYGQASTAAKLAEANKAKAESADQALQQQIFWNSYFKHILGVAPLDEATLAQVVPSVEGDAEMAVVHKNYQQDMVTYGEGLPQEKMNYRELPQNLLIGAIQKLNAASTDLALHNDRLSKEKESVTQAETTRTEEANQRAKASKDELEAERQKFNTQYAQVRTEKETQLASFTAKEATLNREIAAKTATIDERTKEANQLRVTVSDQRERIEELRDEPFETPDGRIAWVNQETRTVWVNLGLADGLRRQTTFSVYEHEAMNVAPGLGTEAAEEGDPESNRKIDERKGKIEITRVLDQHLAEARIVEDWASDPILPGDQIFSPAWKPGRKISFALAGFMDLDGDGRSDRDLIRSVITMNGGVIDAEVHEDGKMEGELKSSTRYFARGVAPDGTDDALLQAWSTINGQADDLGIEKKDFQVVLDMMGYKSEVRTVGLGKQADPLQFKAEPPEGRARTSTGNVSDIFKERRPPKRTTSGSAY